MLLVIDMKIEGTVRERMMVSYYRYRYLLLLFLMISIELKLDLLFYYFMSIKLS